MTFYLKYRPQNLEDLDQENVRNSLIKIFKSDDTPHAFLFSGPRGTGKTSAARIVAKILNCLHPVKGEPCNECSQCKSISRGESLDVVELDAASHRGIDDVRQIREAVKLAPVSARKKVYIIDEAHMLTTEASNALLKTLEEPPNHVVFILATTNPEKLIETIRSRVTNVFFKKASSSEIIRSLKRVVKGENLKIDDKTLGIIARKAEGSFRDGVKTLEQVSTEIENPIEQNVEEFLFNSKSFNTSEFLKSMSTKSTKESIAMLSQASQVGVGAKELAKNIISELRAMLLLTVDGEQKSTLFNQGSLIELLELFIDASSKLSYSYIEEVPLEIAIIKWCESGKEVGSAKLEVDKGNVKKNKENKKNQESVENKLDEMIKIQTDQSDSQSMSNGTAEDFSLNGFDKIDGQLWSKVLSSIGPDHASTEALLKAAHPMGMNGNQLKLGVYYKFHKEHLESNSHRKVLEDTLNLVTGNSIRVVCELTEPPKRAFTGQNEVPVGLSDVVLTEPAKTNTSLTNAGGEDIINLAEKIFSN